MYCSAVYTSDVLLQQTRLAELESERSQLEDHLEEQQRETHGLHRALSSTTETLEGLKEENSQLQVKLTVRGPVSRYTHTHNITCI